MILSPEDIRKVRPVAENLNDPSRLVTYMREAEALRLIDAIGAGLYRWFDESDFWGDGPFVYARPDGVKISITRQEYDTIMDGGYYTTDCGMFKTEGLRAAIAYIAYSRFVVNNPITPTAYGVVYKDGQFSTRVEDSVMVRSSNEAKKIGEAYLDGVVAHLKALGLLCSCSRSAGASSRDIIVKSRKL